MACVSGTNRRALEEEEAINEVKLCLRDRERESAREQFDTFIGCLNSGVLWIAFLLLPLCPFE